MGEKTDNTVPYVAYESMLSSNERHIKRLWISLIICLAMLFTSNGLWLLYESQFDTVSYEQDGDGINSINTDSDVGDMINESEIED